MKPTPLNIGKPHHHPVGVSLIHRPVPEHLHHLAGHGQHPVQPKRAVRPATHFPGRLGK